MRPITRRHMLKLSAASLAAVGVAGCTEDHIRKFAIVAIAVGAMTLKLKQPALRVPNEGIAPRAYWIVCI